MGQQRSNLVVAASFVVTVGLLIGGVNLVQRVAPNLLPGVFGGGAGGNSAQPGKTQTITLLGDTFSGYSTFRNPEFQEALKQSGIVLSYEDEFDQAKRAEQLSQGKADLLVTTLDQFLKQKPQGKIIGLIDRTVGADAVVLNTKQYPGLKSLLDLNELVAQNQAQGKQLGVTYAADTPSEYLALVLDTRFEAFKLSDFQITPVADASEAWALLQDPSKNMAMAIIWEPFVTQARQQGYTVVLSSADAPTAIVDVIVASDRLIRANPDKLTNLLETYYRRIDTNVRDASQLQTQIAQDGKLTPADAGAVLRGIEFFTAVEAKSWLENGILERRINATAAVLVLAGRLPAVPADPKSLYDAQFIQKSAQNTQTLIDLVRADNPELADRLTGKKPAIAATSQALTNAQVAAAPDIGNLDVRGNVEFGVGSATLTPQGQKTLANLIQQINEFSTQTVAIRVIGHTSKTGSADLNLDLSQQRAQSVVNYLRNNGIKHNIAAEGKGFQEVLPGISPTDARNQRTEIRLVRVK